MKVVISRQRVSKHVELQKIYIIFFKKRINISSLNNISTNYFNFTAIPPPPKIEKQLFKPPPSSY